MTTNPKPLQYNTIKPAGFSTKYRQTKFTPAAILNQYSYNDIIRFMIQTGGYWDPYNCFIKMTVQYSDANQPGVALQLDQSAHTLIDQLLITTNSQEIERIEQYDTISTFLLDMNTTEDVKQTRLHEGIPAGNRNNFNKPVFATTSQQYGFKPCGNIPIDQTAQTAVVGDAWYNKLDGQFATCILPNDGLNQTTFWGLTENISAKTVPQTSSSVPWNSFASVLHFPNKKRWLVPKLHPYLCEAGIGTPQYGSATKKKYMNKMLALICQQEPFIDLVLRDATNTEGPNGQLDRTYNYAEAFTQCRQMSGYGTYNTTATDPLDNNFLIRWRNEIGRCELGLILDNNWQDIQSSSGYAIDNAYLEETANFWGSNESKFLLPQYMGFQRSYSAALSSGFEAFLSSSLPQTCLYNGKIQPLAMPYATKTFTFPLLSSLFGSLMPKDSYRYIPMDYFTNLLFEFRLSPYAFFTSGNISNPQINDALGSEFTSVEQPSARFWTILKMEIYADIYYFDEVVDAQIKNTASSTGIFIHTAQWFLGPQYPLATSQQIIGTWQINMGFESLKMIVMLALSTDYTSYSYCRKQFRLSHNVTSFQLKFGTEYYPPQAIQGHAGNVMGQTTNSEFYQMLQKAFGKLNDVWGDMQVNPINFAITERPYNPTLSAQFLSTTSNLQVNTGTTGGPYQQNALKDYTLGPGCVDTCRGMPWFHENRCVGKALYAMNLEGFPSDDKIISGMDTTKIRPFEIIVNADAVNGTSRGSNLMFFLYADIFYVIKPGNISIYGK